MDEDGDEGRYRAPHGAMQKMSQCSPTNDTAAAAAHAKGVDVDVIDFSYSVQVNKQHKILLRNVSFHIEAGEMVALMGPSGAGCCLPE
jgi:ABC-type multidrug transport system fused ATPase/permease subunit